MLTLALTSSLTVVNAQCYDLIGSNEIATSTPVWYNCSNGEFTLDIETSHNWTGLTVDWGDGSANESFVSWFTDETISHIYSDNYTEYSIVFTSTEGCSVYGELIKRAPLSSTLNGPDHVCQGFPATLTHDETQGDEYLWNFNGGQGTWYPGASPNLTLTFNDPGSYEVFGIVSMEGMPESCSDTARFDVSVAPTPDAIVSLSEEEACGTLVTIAEELIGEAIEYEWTFSAPPFTFSGPTTPEIVFDSPGIHTIQLEATGAFGCVNTSSEIVTVFDSPNADFTVDSVCEGNTSSFTNTTFNSQNSTQIDVMWSFGDGEISEENNPQHTFATPGEYVVMLEMSTPHCTNSTSHVATVNENPAISASSDITSGCAPLTVSFEAASDENSTIEWDFGDNQSTLNSNINHTYSNESIEANVTQFFATATATNMSGCNALQTLEISAMKSSVAAFSSFADGCAPLNTSFTNESENATSFSWNFSDGQVSNEFEPFHTFENTSDSLSSFPVEMIALSENGCNDSITYVIHAFPEFIFDVTLAQNEGCSPLMVQTPEIENASQITWSFGDESNDSNSQMATHVYANESSNTETYTLIAQGVSGYGCIGVFSLPITVNPQPVAHFMTDISEGCSPLVVNVLENSSHAVDLIWNYGDGNSSSEATDETFQYSYENHGEETNTHEISLTVIGDGGCLDVQVLDINVFPEVHSQFSAPPATCSPFSATFTNEGSENELYNWNFGDGEVSEDENPTHVFTNPSSNQDAYLDVTLTVTSAMGCSNISTEVVTALATPNANMSFSQSEGCGSFYATAVEVHGDGENYQWTFNMAPYSHNGSTTPELLFNIPGTHELQLEVSSANGCSTEISDSVNVYEIPQVNFSVEDVCYGTTSEFTDESETFGEDEIVEWVWTFGNEDITFEQNPNYTYNSAGVHHVGLIISTEFCSSIFNSTTYVESIPEMTAFADNTEGCSPSLIHFEAQTNDDASVLWDFGDAQISHDLNNDHTYYNENGEANTIVFSVSATATSPLGCLASDSLEISVLRSALASATSSGEGCAPLNTIFTNNSENASEYAWTFSEESFSNDFEPIHTFENTSDDPQTFAVELIAIAENGCNDTTSVETMVYPEMFAQFFSPQADCSPFEVGFTNESSPNTTCAWSFGDGIMSTELNPSHIFSTDITGDDTTFDVELTITSEHGCSNSTTSEIAVYVSPVIDFSATPITQTFPNATIEIEEISTSGSSSTTLWNFGDGNISTNESPGTHTYETWGVFSISVALSNDYCADTAEEMITIITPTPVLSFAGNGEGCAPYTLDFTNLSQYAHNFKWNFGDGTSSLSEHATHTFTQAGTYDITLEAMSYDGVLINETHYAAVTVFPRAQSNFSLFPTEVFAPGEPIDFYNLSADADEFVWYFGNGETSVEEHPTYEYTVPGNYNVTLTANNEWGCASTFSFENAVTAKDGGLLVFPTAFTPVPGGGNGGSYDLQAHNNDVFRPLHGGVVEFEIFVFNKYGEQIFHSSDINVGWDGYVFGELASQDVYAYKAMANLSDGTILENAGTVTLISK